MTCQRLIVGLALLALNKSDVNNGNMSSVSYNYILRKAYRVTCTELILDLQLNISSAGV